MIVTLAINTNRRIYRIVDDALTEVYLYSQTPVGIKSINNNLAVTTQNNIFIYNSNFSLLSQIPLIAGFDTKFTSVTMHAEDVYIGSENFGVLKTSLSNPENFEEIHPEMKVKEELAI